MTWKKILRSLERSQQWDTAIEFMQQVISDNQADLDAYLFMLFLIMNLLVEEDHNESKHNHYEMLAKKYFDEAYEKFSDNPEFLYYAGKTAVMSEWYFGIEQDDYIKMMARAAESDPHNPVYQWNYYDELATENVRDENARAYAITILDKNSSINKILSAKGALGEYLLEIMRSWSKRVLEERLHLYRQKH